MSAIPALGIRFGHIEGKIAILLAVIDSVVPILNNARESCCG
ncbi:MAG: hypothetical protein ACE1Z1_03180 [Candidatus Acidiferrales bacterium]|jgi:hypothetical protein